MVDIVCYTNPSTLVGLQLQSCIDEPPTWTLRSSPKHIGVGDRIYFACNKKIRGYFTLISYCKGNRLIEKKQIKGTHLEIDNWKELKPIVIKDFRNETGGSWRYASKIFKKIITKDDNY